MKTSENVPVGNSAQTNCNKNIIFLVESFLQPSQNMHSYGQPKDPAAQYQRQYQANIVCPDHNAHEGVRNQNNLPVNSLKVNPMKIQNYPYMIMENKIYHIQV